MTDIPRLVRYDRIGRFKVSTAFVADAKVFETMIFDKRPAPWGSGASSILIGRQETEEEALIMHLAATAAVRGCTITRLRKT